MKYPKERKEAILEKILPPQNKPITEIAKKEGFFQGRLKNRHTRSKNIRLKVGRSIRRVVG